MTQFLLYALGALVIFSGALYLRIRSLKSKNKSLEFKLSFADNQIEDLLKNKKAYEKSIENLTEIKLKYEKQIKDINTSHGSDLSDKLNSL